VTCFTIVYSVLSHPSQSSHLSRTIRTGGKVLHWSDRPSSSPSLRWCENEEEEAAQSSCDKFLILLHYTLGSKNNNGAHPLRRRVTGANFNIDLQPLGDTEVIILLPCGACVSMRGWKEAWREFLPNPCKLWTYSSAFAFTGWSELASKTTRTLSKQSILSLLSSWLAICLGNPAANPLYCCKRSSAPCMVNTQPQGLIVQTL